MCFNFSILLFNLFPFALAFYSSDTSHICESFLLNIWSIFWFYKDDGFIIAFSFSNDWCLIIYGSKMIELVLPLSNLSSFLDMNILSIILDCFLCLIIFFIIFTSTLFWGEIFFILCSNWLLCLLKWEFSPWKNLLKIEMFDTKEDSLKLLAASAFSVQILSWCSFYNFCCRRSRVLFIKLFIF